MTAVKYIQKYSLHIYVYPSRKELGSSAARNVGDTIREMLQQKDFLNIIFAAAPSQNEFLESLRKQQGIEWQRINAFHMDEYVGLPLDAPQRFGNYLKEHIFNTLPFYSINYLNGNGSVNTDEECERYSRLLEQHPVDIVCMGIGENGHIAFNDPHVADFYDPVLVKQVDLDDACRQQQVNDGCFSSFEKVPTHALTLTIPALMKASHLFCMVPGQAKAWAVSHMVNGPVSEDIPATCLRKHEHATIYVDMESAAMLG
ncbi:MAG: glucosamine-6-phosphate deaminase [Bacteroidales bacterium]|jgi:glucosamine-6-phosphate deaminase|nr:glucosamine-6-phosphate deaminase [Bacteroidales bacterium]